VSAREVVLGVGGGIAAYKSCDLLRRLQDAGFGVTVIPTPSSLHFVGKATWEALSGRAVTTTVWERVDEVRHVHLAKVSEFNIIAPATADLIARIAQGRADDLLTNTILASTAPTLVVPAMHPAMWANQATQSNVSVLRDRGYVVMEPDHGRLTGGDTGVGRFPETSRILATFKEMTDRAIDLAGVKVLVTAGGTREMIDPIRYIGNNSSGRQGFAIAKAAMKRGAEVTLVLANSSLPDLPGITTIRVTSADQMYTEVNSRFASCDVIAMSAAVADAKPSQYSDSKIKKGSLSSIELSANKDIIASVARNKGKQIVIAFAAETSLDLVEGERKLMDKSADILYLNDVSGSEIFGSDETQGVILTSRVSQPVDRVIVERISKDTLADLLLDQALSKLG
jgi:phosphopantothenoylcysteine decarboxylase/phosphopantothenate--cysteine ligase